MNRPDRDRMTVEEFHVSGHLGSQSRLELHDGRVVALSDESFGHWYARGYVYRALAAAAAEQGDALLVRPCGAMLDIDAHTAYEPDALVCEVTAGDAAGRPLIAVEVLSAASESTDLIEKLAGYFRRPSLRHYLIVDPDRHLVVHHRADADGALVTRVVNDGELALDPPGLIVAVQALLGRG